MGQDKDMDGAIIIPAEVAQHYETLNRKLQEMVQRLQEREMLMYYTNRQKHLS